MRDRWLRDLTRRLNRHHAGIIGDPEISTRIGSYGRTDDLGFHIVENSIHVHDLQATILHLLGFDHTRLTFRFKGRDFRLTDVGGRVIQEILGKQSVVKVPRAPRPFLRPPDKALWARIPGVCARIATRSAPVQGRSNAVTTFTRGS